MKGAIQTKVPEQVIALVDSGVYDSVEDACMHFVNYILKHWMPKGGGLFEFNEFFLAAPPSGTISAMAAAYLETEPRIEPRQLTVDLDEDDLEFIERIRVLQRAVTDQAARAVDRTHALTQPMQFDGHASRFVNAHHAIYDAIWLHATEMLPHLKTATWELTVSPGGKSFVLQYSTNDEQAGKAE